MDKLQYSKGSIFENGWGFIPKKVMKDINLSLQAKGIYSYLAAYAGSESKAFPSRDLIIHELQITKDTFYKYLEELINAGYINKEQERAEGKFKRNNYIIELIPCPKLSDTIKSDTVKPDTTFSDTTNNSLTNNNLTNNRIIYIYDYWNFKEIVNHRKLTDKLKRAISGALSNYTEEEIKQSIDNYKTILTDDKYFWSHTWGLKEFLERGIDKFINFDIAAKNYKANKLKEEKKPNGSNYGGQREYNIKELENQLLGRE